MGNVKKVTSKDFKWAEKTSQFNEKFIIIYNEDGDIGYFVQANDQYPENLHKIHNELSFLSEIMKIENNEKFVANLDDKEQYVIHIRNLKEGLSQY